MQFITRGKKKKMLLKASLFVLCMFLVAVVYNVHGRPASLKFKERQVQDGEEPIPVIKEDAQNSKKSVIDNNVVDSKEKLERDKDDEPPVPVPKEPRDLQMNPPDAKLHEDVHLMEKKHNLNVDENDGEHDERDEEYDEDDAKQQSDKEKDKMEEEGDDDKEPLPDDDHDDDDHDDEDIRVKLHVDDTNLRHRHEDDEDDRPLKLAELEPMDHLEGVRMEQDGHLNRDYKKEIFLGNHEEFEHGTEEEIRKKLEDVFFRVDSDKEGHIEQEELEEWIQLKVQEHFDEAKEENEKIFQALDTDGDGRITWKEFHIQFLVAKGHSENKAEKHAEDYETIPLQAHGELLVALPYFPRVQHWLSTNKTECKLYEVVNTMITGCRQAQIKWTLTVHYGNRHVGAQKLLAEKEKEHLIRFKFRWAEADEDPQDNKLDKEEFRSFRHPEQSRNTLIRMVQDIVDNLDKDGDGVLTEDEFIALPPGDVDAEWEKSDKIWQEERQKEFRNVIDSDKDGKVTKEELARYVDPKNPNHAIVEARNLIQLADNNQDGRLSLQEVLDNSQLFLGSKMVDTGRSFHDEF